MKKSFFICIAIIATISTSAFAQEEKGAFYTDINLNASYITGMNDLNNYIVDHYGKGEKLSMTTLQFGGGIGYMITDGLSAFANAELQIGRDRNTFGENGSKTMHSMMCMLGIDYNFGNISKVPFSLFAGIGWETVNFATSSSTPYVGVAVNTNNIILPIGVTWWMTKKLGFSLQYTLPVYKGSMSESKVYSDMPGFSTNGAAIGLKARF